MIFEKGGWCGLVVLVGKFGEWGLNVSYVYVEVFVVVFEGYGVVFDGFDGCGEVVFVVFG